MIVLDSDILIGFLRNIDEAVGKITEFINNQILICTTSINAAELYFGANLSGKKDENLKSVENLLSKLEIFPFTANSGKIYGDIRANLQREGEMINELDIFIAAIVKENNMKLITKNVRHFEKINNLKIESW